MGSCGQTAEEEHCQTTWLDAAKTEGMKEVIYKKKMHYNAEISGSDKRMNLVEAGYVANGVLIMSMYSLSSDW